MVDRKSDRHCHGHQLHRQEFTGSNVAGYFQRPQPIEGSICGNRLVFHDRLRCWPGCLRKTVRLGRNKDGICDFDFRMVVVVRTAWTRKESGEFWDLSSIAGFE